MTLSPSVFGRPFKDRSADSTVKPGSLKNEREFIENLDEFEFWWNIPVTMSTRLRSSRPDIVLWDGIKKRGASIKVASALDVNIISKEKDKEFIHGS